MKTTENQHPIKQIKRSRTLLYRGGPLLSVAYRPGTRWHMICESSICSTLSAPALESAACCRSSAHYLPQNGNNHISCDCDSCIQVINFPTTRLNFQNPAAVQSTAYFGRRLFLPYCKSREWEVLGRAWGLVCTYCIYYLHGLNAILSQADLWMLYKSLSKWI